MGSDLDAFKALAREILAVSPATILVCVYRPDSFPSEVWEDGASGTVFVEAIRAGVRDVLRRPVSKSDVEQLFSRLSGEQGIVKRPDIASVVSFISNKGGVGKSTSAVNAAVRLAQRHPQRVLLVDASLQMGVCASMLDLQPKTTILDAVRESGRLDETLVRQLAIPHRSGLDLLAAPPDAISATEIDDEMISRVLTLARRTYDYVIVDTFPLFDRIVISVLDLSDLVYVVLDNVVPTVLSVAHLISLLDGLEYDPDRQRVLLNRFTRSSASPSVDDVAAQLGRPVAHCLPFDKRALTAANVGEPFALSPRRWAKLDIGLQGVVDEIEAIRMANEADSARSNESSSVNGQQQRTTSSNSDGERGQLRSTRSDSPPTEESIVATESGEESAAPNSEFSDDNGI